MLGWLAIVMGLSGLCSAMGTGTEATPPAGFAAVDWVTTGADCRLFAAGDLDDDGYADVLTVNGGRDLCVALSVNGWKAAGWIAIAHDVNPEAQAIGLAEFGALGPGVEAVVLDAAKAIVFTSFDGGALTQRHEIAAPPEATLTLEATGTTGVVRAASGAQHWTLRGGAFVEDASAPSTAPAPQQSAHDAAAERAAPPYERSAQCLGTYSADFNRDGVADSAFLYDCHLPHHARAMRVLLSPNPLSTDQDSDGLSDAEEASIGTDPNCGDTDGDGLRDGWEVHGFPRGIDLGAFIGLYDSNVPTAERDGRLSPLRQDVIVNVSYFEGVKPEQFRKEMPLVQKVYRELNTANADGSKGIWVHFRELAGLVPMADQKMAWWDVGNKYFPKSERGIMHWMQVTPFGGGQSSETGDMGGCGNGWAVFAHEFGHQLSLSHTGDSAPGWCPLYTSLMNYAYSYSFDGDGAKPHLSNGEFKSLSINEHRLREQLPFAYERVKFLSNHPFRFPLKDNGDGTTLIDWNQNGSFDAGEVEADVNYGGSTHAGERQTHTLIGSAPSLAYVGDRCLLAASDHKQNYVTIKSYKGDKQWTKEQNVGGSPSRFDPVLAGGPDFGGIFVRRFNGWAYAKVQLGTDAADPPQIDALVDLPGVPIADLSALRVGDRFLLITRHDDDSMERRWLTPGEKPLVSDATPMKLTSMVPLGLCMNPSDGSIVVVSSSRHPKHGPFCMQVCTLSVDGDAISESDPEWTRGSGHNHCTARPTAVFHRGGGDPQLVVFHTGWTDGGGLWSAWRTMRVGNKALDDGWLTSQLYDQWTRSRVAPGFADGPQGAIYAFRWDAGDHHDWKINTMFVAYNGYGIDDEPMSDFDDGAKISLWGIRQSILTMQEVPADTSRATESSGPTTSSQTEK